MNNMDMENMAQDQAENAVEKARASGGGGSRLAPKPKKNKKALAITLSVLGVAVLAAAGVMLYMNSRPDDMSGYEYIFPNVYVAGVNVGGLTEDEALQRVRSEVETSFQSNALVVELPDRRLTFTPEQTKAAIDAESAVAKAYAYGREGSSRDVSKAYEAAKTSEYHIELDTELDIDRDYIREIIDGAASEIQSDLVETTYDISGDRIVIHVGTSQKRMDSDGLYDLVLNAFMTNDFTTINYEYETVKPKQVDIEALYSQLCVEPKNAAYDPATGQITPEVTGLVFDLESERQYLAFAEEGSDHTILLQTVEPEITMASLQELLFRDKLASYSSTLSGSNYNRNINVTLACEAINGTILQPGETFSFNNVVGQRTAEKGYTAATVYVSGESVPQLGGGICQVASTIYLVTLLSNLEIVERECHQFLVTYVPYGQDATIYWGSLDYKFKNNTDYPLRIDAGVSGGSVNVAFYGTKLDDTYVEMEYTILGKYSPDYVTEQDPEKPEGYSEVKQTAYTGYSVRTTRNVYNGDGSRLSSEFEASSYYQKRNQITIVGTGGETSENPDASADPDVPTDDPGASPDVSASPGVSATPEATAPVQTSPEVSAEPSATPSAEPSQAPVETTSPVIPADPVVTADE